MGRYQEDVRARSLARFLVGLIVRLLNWAIAEWKIIGLRRSGAKIGSCVAIARGVRLQGGANLVIGNHCSFQSANIDTRATVKIGNYVIVGEGVHIITCSHDIDDTEWKLKRYGVEIGDYVWLATNSMVLPSCRRIGRGAVIGAGAVVVKDVPDMAIVSGNPANIIRYRNCVHEDCVVEKFLSCDLLEYLRARFTR